MGEEQSGPLSGAGGGKAPRELEVRKAEVRDIKSTARALVQELWTGPGELHWQASSLARGTCERVCVHERAQERQLCTSMAVGAFSPSAPCLPWGAEVLRALQGELVPLRTTDTDQGASGLGRSYFRLLLRVKPEGRCPIKPKGPWPL